MRFRGKASRPGLFYDDLYRRPSFPGRFPEPGCARRRHRIAAQAAEAERSADPAVAIDRAEYHWGRVRGPTGRGHGRGIGSGRKLLRLGRDRPGRGRSCLGRHAAARHVFSRGARSRDVCVLDEHRRADRRHRPVGVEPERRHELHLRVGGSTYTITPTANTLSSLAHAINRDNDANVQATIVNIGSPSAPDYRLSLQGIQLGILPIELTADNGSDPGLLLTATYTTGAQAQYRV